MDEKPKVSVIIPVYNVESYLNRCVNSVIDQTLQNFEVLLVDDGSTDSSGTICDQLASEDDRLRVIHKANGGLSSARNAGMDAALGDYIFFLDSDDWLENNALERLVNLIEKYQVDFVRFMTSRNGFVNYPENSPSILEEERLFDKGFYSREDIEKTIFPRLFTTPSLLMGPIVGAYASLYRRGFLNDHSLKFYEDVRYSEDMNFSANVVYYAQSMYYIDDEIIYHYFCNPNSISRSFKSERWKSCQNIIRHFEEDYKDTDYLVLANQIERVRWFNLLVALNEARFIRDQREKIKFKLQILSEVDPSNFTITPTLYKISSKLMLKMRLIRTVTSIMTRLGYGR